MLMTDMASEPSGETMIATTPCPTISLMSLRRRRPVRLGSVRSTTAVSTSNPSAKSARSMRCFRKFAARFGSFMVIRR